MNKTKFNTLTLLFILLSTTVFSQTANFTWTDWAKNGHNGYQNPNIIFPTTEDFTIYSIEKSGSHVYAPKLIYITKHDYNRQVLKDVNFKLPQRQRMDATLIDVIEGDNKLYFFSNIALKKDGKNVLYVQVFDNNSFTISEEKELFTLPIEKVNNSGFFNVEISPDKNTLAVLVNNVFEKKQNEKITTVLFDKDLNEIANSNFTLNFESERAYKEQLYITNDKTIHIVKHTDIFKKEPKTTVITINGTDINTQQVSSPEFYISDSKVITVANTNYLIGFATDNVKPGISVGGKKDKSFFLYDITNGNLVINQGWSDAILKKVLGKGFLDLTVQNVLTQDNNIYLIGECFKSESALKEGASFEYDYTYNIGPGIVVKLDTAGDVKYESYLKYSDTYKNEAKRIASFYPFLDNGKLNLLTTEKEYVLKEKKIVLGSRKIEARAVVLNTIDDAGEQTIVPFWDSKVGGEDLIIDFAPTFTKQIDTTNFAIYGYGNLYHAFGKMTLN